MSEKSSLLVVDEKYWPENRELDLVKLVFSAESSGTTNWISRPLLVRCLEDTNLSGNQRVCAK